MPLPLTVSCSSKIQIGFTFLIPAYLGSPGKMAVKRVCVLFCQKLITSLVFLVSCSVSAIVLCCWLYFEIFTCAPICENNIIQCLNALGLLSPAHCLWTNSRNTAKSCREWLCGYLSRCLLCLVCSRWQLCGLGLRESASKTFYFSSNKNEHLPSRLCCSRLSWNRKEGGTVLHGVANYCIGANGIRDMGNHLHP